MKDFNWSIEQIADSLHQGPEYLLARVRRNFLHPHPNIWPAAEIFEKLINLLSGHLDDANRKKLYRVCLASWLLAPNSAPAPVVG